MIINIPVGTGMIYDNVIVKKVDDKHQAYRLVAIKYLRDYTRLTYKKIKR